MKIPEHLSAVVYVRSRFVGFHRWKDAPERVAFLRDFHRHEFHVRVAVAVGHGNREVEFFMLQDRVNSLLRQKYEGKRFEESCEMIAVYLQKIFDANFVEVSEDGENGAIVMKNTFREMEKAIQEGFDKTIKEVGHSIDAFRAEIKDADSQLLDALTARQRGELP